MHHVLNVLHIIRPFIMSLFHPLTNTSGLIKIETYTIRFDNLQTDLFLNRMNSSVDINEAGKCLLVFLGKKRTYVFLALI